MLFFTLINKNIRPPLVIICTMLFLIGCPSLPNKGHNEDQIDLPSYYYINQINNSSSTTKINWQFLAIRAFINENNLLKATDYLNRIPENINENQFQEKQLITAELQVALRTFSHVQTQLNKISFSLLTRSQQIRYHQIQINVTPSDNILLKLRSYVALEQLVASKQRQVVIDKTWNTLLQAKPHQLSSLAIRSSEETLKSWLTLLDVYQSNHNNPLQLKANIDSWQAQYPRSPISKLLPSQLTGQLTSNLLNTNNVALLLPLDEKGKQFAEPIVAGFEAAIKESHATNFQFKVYDTSNISMIELMQRVQNEGYGLVVGPLLKDNVQNVVNIPTTLRILTLNTPDIVVNHNNICYFSLSPEDEARQAAQYIFKQNKTMPLIITSQTDYGQRTAKAFDQEWAKLAGQGVLVQFFYSVKDLKEAINNGTGIKLEGVPIVAGYSVPDMSIDAIYVAASQDELILIKAMLDMDSSSHITDSLYANSRSNQAGSGPDFRLEMDGLKFTEIPLIARTNSSLYQQAIKIFNGDYNQIRLYAMGFDAWTLANNFTELHRQSDYQIPGMTGQLRSENNCVISRQLSWLEYRQGRLISIQ